MRSTTMRWLTAAVALCSAHGARAQLNAGSGAVTARDGDWSATAARSVGRGANVVQAEAGWPYVGFTWLHGLDDRSDLGARANFVYGFEGTTNSVAGVQLQIPYRFMLTGRGDVNVGLHMDPGLTIYGNADANGNTGGGGTLVGIGGPLGIVAGVRATPALTLDAGIDFPVLLSFSHPVGVLFGPQLGGGAEYLLERNLAITLRARFGPEFAVANGATGSQFAFSTLIGLAYNVR